MTAIELRDALRKINIQVDFPDEHITGKFIMVAWLEIDHDVIIDHPMPFYRIDAPVSKGELDNLKWIFKKFKPEIEQL